MCSRTHPNWPMLKIIPRPSIDPSTGEIPAPHHNPGAPTLLRNLVHICLASLGEYEHALRIHLSSQALERGHPLLTSHGWVSEVLPTLPSELRPLDCVQRAGEHTAGG